MSIVLADPEPFVEAETLNDSSVDLLVRPFCKGEHYFDVQYSLPEMVKKALDKNKIEIPFPHRKVILFKGDWGIIEPTGIRGRFPPVPKGLALVGHQHSYVLEASQSYLLRTAKH